MHAPREYSNPFTRVTHTHVGVRGVPSTNHWPAPSYEARENTMVFPSDVLTFPPYVHMCVYISRVCTRARVRTRFYRVCRKKMGIGGTSVSSEEFLG